MPLYASMDIGSNTIRLLIGDVKEKKIIDKIYARKITRLGAGISQTGKLQDVHIESSVKVVREFSSIISDYSAKLVKAVATSALREASNADIFIKRVFKETGISIEVISGEKEAQLTLMGIILSLPDTFLLYNKSLFIIDIGGGSTEWIYYKNSLLNIGSIPIGVIKLREKFIKTDPISEDDLTELINNISLHIKTIKYKIGNLIDEKTRLIGTAGTFTTIASIDIGLDTYSREKIHLHTILLKRLIEINNTLVSLTIEERKKIKGLEKERADLIIPGVQFTIKLMDLFNFTELTISDYGLLEGILLNFNKGNR